MRTTRMPTIAMIIDAPAPWRIAQVAALSGVPAVNIRFYE
jgi:hypothetical protein